MQGNQLTFISELWGKSLKYPAEGNKLNALLIYILSIYLIGDDDQLVPHCKLYYSTDGLLTEYGTRRVTGVNHNDCLDLLTIATGAL
jgi:hypothetical protein